jgi:hypothetical protein
MWVYNNNWLYISLRRDKNPALGIFLCLERGFKSTRTLVLDLSLGFFELEIILG